MSILKWGKGLQRSTKIGLSVTAVFCAVLFGAIFTSSSVHAATTNKCRTMIYRSDTAGYTSGYVEVCADVKDDGTISKITSVNSNGTKGEILANVDAHFYDNTSISQQITVCRYGGSSCESGTKTQFFIGDKLGSADKNISQVYTKFSEYTDKVLYGVSDLVGYSTSQVVDDSRSDCENMIDNFCTTIPGTKKITYSYNGIYDGSYSDWENAGYPDGQGQTYTQPQDPNDPNAAGGSTTSGSSETDPCYSNAESLGWILCPLTTWLNNALGSVYENIVEPFLQIDSGLVSTKNEGTYAAWGVFRNMANIVFVILILVVVFSQVTGVGINNYGIKKALPKIIVVAILINLSYILCQLAVDVSNILGSGVENLLTGIGDKISGLSPKGSTSTPVQQMQNILGGLLTAVGIGAAGAAAAVVMGGAGIVVLLLSLVSALLSVIFFFIILGLRKAGVVLLVALAPLAIVCAALPNTDKIFQRWLGIFKALLFVYPIAGALIGGGYLAAVILLQAGGSDAWLQIIAMLLFVVPFLALPSLLKKSIAGADQIFGSIVNKGEGLTAKARGGVQNSDVMKRNREQMAKNRRDFKLSDPIGSFKAGRTESRNARTMRRNARDTRIERSDNQAVKAMAEGLMGRDVDDLEKGYKNALDSGNLIDARAHMEALSQTHTGRNALDRQQRGAAAAAPGSKANSTAARMGTYLAQNDSVRTKAPHIINDLDNKSANDLAAMDAEALRQLSPNAYARIARTALDENKDRMNQGQIDALEAIAAPATPTPAAGGGSGGAPTPTADGIRQQAKIEDAVNNLDAEHLQNVIDNSNNPDAVNAALHAQRSQAAATEADNTARREIRAQNAFADQSKVSDEQLRHIINRGAKSGSNVPIETVRAAHDELQRRRNNNPPNNTP